MRLRLVLAFAAVALSATASTLPAQQYFGQNLVQYRHFRWRVLETERYAAPVDGKADGARRLAVPSPTRSAIQATSTKPAPQTMSTIDTFRSRSDTSQVPTISTAMAPAQAAKTST